jgi:hypothetical protein
LHHAIEAAPGELDYRLNLVKFLMIKDHFPEAKIELAKVAQLDKSRIYEGEIKSLEEAIATHAQQPAK